MSYVQSQEAAGCCSADRMRRAKKAMFGLLVLAATTGLAFVIEQVASPPNPPFPPTPSSLQPPNSQSMSMPCCFQVLHLTGVVTGRDCLDLVGIERNCQGINISRTIRAADGVGGWGFDSAPVLLRASGGRTADSAYFQQHPPVPPNRPPTCCSLEPRTQVIRCSPPPSIDFPFLLSNRSVLILAITRFPHHLVPDHNDHTRSTSTVRAREAHVATIDLQQIDALAPCRAGLLGAMWGYGKGLAAAAFGVTGSAIVCFLISR